MFGCHLLDVCTFQKRKGDLWERGGKGWGWEKWRVWKLWSRCTVREKNRFTIKKKKQRRTIERSKWPLQEFLFLELEFILKKKKVRKEGSIVLDSTIVQEYKQHDRACPQSPCCFSVRAPTLAILHCHPLIISHLCALSVDCNTEFWSSQSDRSWRLIYYCVYFSRPVIN